MTRRAAKLLMLAIAILTPCAMLAWAKPLIVHAPLATEGLAANSLRPDIFPAIPQQAVDAGYFPNDLSTSVRTNVTPTTRAAVVEIAGGSYSSPYTASTADRTIRLMGNVTYETGGIIISANNVTVDLNGYTLTYKNVGPASVATATVDTASDPSRPTITQTGLTLTADSHWTFVVEFTSGAESGNFYEVYSNTTTEIVLENHNVGGVSNEWENGGPANGDTFRIYNSRLTAGVRSDTRTGIEVVNGYIVEGAGYGRGSNIRSGEGCNPIMLLDTTATVAGVKVTWDADNCLGIRTGENSTIKYCEVDDQGTVVTNRQRTIGAVNPKQGSTVQYNLITNHRHAGIYVGSNNIVEYNELYGDSRATNSYGIGTFGGDGNIFRYNNIYKVGEHPECIAIHAEDESAGAQDNEVHHNWGEAKATRSSAEYGWNYAVGISRRWGITTLPNSFHDECHITYSEDGPDANQESRGRTAWFGALQDTAGEVVEDCFFGAYNTDDETECHAIGLSSHNNLVTFTRCTFASSHNVFWFGDPYGPAASGGRFIDCTALTDGSDPGFYTFSTWEYEACDVDMIGTTFGAGTAEDDIYLLATGANIETQRINFGDMLNVTVTESGSPVEGATVAVKDKDSNTLRSGYVTAANGVVAVDVPNRYRQRPGFSSTTLNPLTVEAVDGASDGTNTISPTGEDSISVGIAP